MINWLNKILTRSLKKRPISNHNSGKSFDEKYAELGCFTYTDKGFTINYEELTKTLDWNDITKINVFKSDLLTIDRVDMEIVYGEKYFTITEDLPGWYQFVIKTKEVFPMIPIDWDLEITQPAFARNYKTIYTKQIQ